MRYYGLVDLAEAAELRARTVRYYQASGLIPGPRRVGRTAQYDESHLARLHQIADLRSSGLKLDTIRDLLDGGGHGRSPVVSLMGAGPSGEKWLSDTERTFSVTELAELLGSRHFDLLESLETHGYLERRSDDEGTHWYCPDVPLLRGALQLHDLGTEVELSARARDLLNRRLRRLAEDLVDLWHAESGGLYAGDAATDLPQQRHAVRAVAWQSAAYVMAKEIERAVQARAVVPPDADSTPDS